MTINLPVTYTQVKAGYDVVSIHVKKWGNYLIQQIDIASLHIKNDKRLAVASLVVANVVIFELAIGVARIVSNVMNEYQHFRDLGDSERNWRGLAIEVITVGIIGGCNWAFCEYMSIPLTEWHVAAISFSTCLIYLVCKIKYKNPDLIY